MQRPEDALQGQAEPELRHRREDDHKARLPKSTTVIGRSRSVLPARGAAVTPALDRAAAVPVPSRTTFSIIQS